MERTEQTNRCPGCGAPSEPHRAHCNYCGGRSTESLDPAQQAARIIQIQKVASQEALSATQTLELAELLTAGSKIAHAREYLRQSIELDPNAHRPRILLVLSLLGFNQSVCEDLHPGEVEEHFTWLQANHPDLAETRWMNVLFQLDPNRSGPLDRTQTIERGTAAVEAYPWNYLLHYWLSMAHLHWGDTDQCTLDDFRSALRHFQLSAELNPDFIPSVQNTQAVTKLIQAAQDTVPNESTQESVSSPSSAIVLLIIIGVVGLLVYLLIGDGG